MTLSRFCLPFSRSPGQRSTERGILQLLSLFLFVSVWCYVYFSSKMWSTVAVLVAGYGVYPLMVPCDDLNQDCDFLSSESLP